MKIFDRLRPRAEARPRRVRLRVEGGSKVARSRCGPKVTIQTPGQDTKGKIVATTPVSPRPGWS
jgi:hypothetical protein